MISVVRWVNGELIHRDMEILTFHQLYEHSLYNCISVLREGMISSGNPVHDQSHCMQAIKEFDPDAVFWFVGPTWISAIGLIEDWHSPERILAEEIVGPRFSNLRMDFKDYVSAMAALSTKLGVPEFQIGTMSNPRKSALVRYMEQTGMEAKTTIMRRRM